MFDEFDEDAAGRFGVEEGDVVVPRARTGRFVDEVDSHLAGRLQRRGHVRRGQRDVVAFATYWGAAGLLLYPVVASEPGAWNAVHVAVPLTIPAAVAVAAIYRRGRRARAGDRRELAAVTSVALILIGGHVAAGAVGAAAGSPNGGPLAGADQPEDDLRAALDPVAAAAESNDGVDVGVFGSELRTQAERRPLDWYLRLADAEVESYDTTFNLPDDPPPVVIAANVTDDDSAEPSAERVAAALNGYDRLGPYEARGDGSLPLVVFVDRDR